MNTVWSVVATAVLATGFIPEATAENTAEPVVDRPARTIVLQRCQKCHGPEGQSADPEFPRLAGQNADYLTRQLVNFKTGARKNKRMQRKVEDLTGGEMRALAVYFSEQPLVRDPAEQPPVDPERVDAGRRLYFAGDPARRVTSCATCHGPEGRGGMFLPRLAGQHAEYLARQMRAFLDQSRSSPNMVMHTVIENLAEDDIESLAQFLSVMD